MQIKVLAHRTNFSSRKQILREVLQMVQRYWRIDKVYVVLNSSGQISFGGLIWHFMWCYILTFYVVLHLIWHKKKNVFMRLELRPLKTK
jgi:hypothetical protein